MNMNTIKRVLRECKLEIESIDRDIGEELDCPVIYVHSVKGYQNISEEQKQNIVDKMPYSDIGDNDLCFIDKKENLIIY